MAHESVLDDKTGRKFHLDFADDVTGGGLTFVLNIHGGGSAGAWQRKYFPAYLRVNERRLVIAAPTAATTAPTSHWVAEADDEHLHNVVDYVFARFGADAIRAFWLAGHSQGGMTCNRLLATPFFAGRVDGWLSLSGGRMGRAEMASDFGPPRTPEERERMAGFMRNRFRPQLPGLHEADFSFIYATGEHEIVALPDASPWAEKYGAAPKQRLDDVVDTEPGLIHDSRWDGRATPSWGRKPSPGTARVYVYPGARDGRVIADIVRVDKGHTEGLEPNITDKLLELIASAPGGKPRALDDASTTA